MHYYQFNIADYRKDTSHLTPIEHYIYRTLIDWYYLDELPIPKETQLVLRRLCLASEIEPQLNNVLNDFFTLQDNWYHLRIEKEIADYKANVDKNRRNGMLGGRPKKTHSVILDNPNETENKANQTLTNNHKPITNKQKINTPDGVALTLWSDFLTLRRAKKLPITQTALDGIEREAKKADLTMAQAITICCERGWGGFKADWLKAEAVKEKDNQEWRTNDAAMVKKANELKVNTKGKTRFELIAAIDIKMREL